MWDVSASVNKFVKKGSFTLARVSEAHPGRLRWLASVENSGDALPARAAAACLPDPGNEKTRFRGFDLETWCPGEDSNLHGVAPAST